MQYHSSTCNISFSSTIYGNLYAWVLCNDILAALSGVQQLYNCKQYWDNENDICFYYWV